MSHTTPSSVRIFAAARDGRNAAATELFDRYVRRLARFARSRLAPQLTRRVDPEDIVMSAYRSFFVAARAGRLSVNDAGDLWALLTTITWRKVMRQADYHHAAKRSVQAEYHTDERYQLAEWIVSHEPGPDEAALLTDEVETLLRSLSADQRRIVELRLQGESTADIATATGVSERTVRRVLATLQEDLRREHHLADKPMISVDRLTESGCTQNSVSQNPPSVNSTVDYSDLLIERLVGRGGMGKVYQAVDRRDQTPVAVKFLHRSFRNHADIASRFLDEAAVVESLSHPVIVDVRGIGQTPSGVYFIVMELIDGHDVGQMGLPVETATAVDWSLSLAGALNAAHAQNVIHCDLKPANVLIRSNGSPVIVDFGLAHRLDSDETQLRAVAGTAPWMAPEQIEPHRGPIGPTTDVYGLGALLYTLLTGQPPFPEQRMADVMAQVVSAINPQPPAQIVDGVDPEVEEFCLRCLAKNPADRPQSMTEMIKALTKIGEQQTKCR